MKNSHNAKGGKGYMLLEVILAQDDADLGVAGTRLLVASDRVVAIGRHGDDKAVLFLDLSDLEKFKKVYTEEPYSKWYALKLNV